VQCIGSSSGSSALVTIDASDASGNPLTASSGFVLAGSLTPSGAFGAGGASSANESGVASGGSDLAAPSFDNSVGGTSSRVPEPSTLVLVFLALSSRVGQRVAQRRRRRVLLH
jgi:hypothetical protein